MSFSLADIRRDYDILMVAKDDAEEYVVKKMYSGSQHFKEIIEKIKIAATNNFLCIKIPPYLKFILLVSKEKIILYM